MGNLSDADRAEIKQKAMDFLAKRTKQRDNLVITKAEAVNGLVDFYAMLHTPGNQDLKDITLYQLLVGELGFYDGAKYEARKEFDIYCTGCDLASAGVCDESPARNLSPKCNDIIFKKVE